MIMLSIFKNKHFNKSSKATHVFPFFNFIENCQKSYYSTCIAPYPLITRLTKRQVSNADGLSRQSTTMSLIELKGGFNTLQPRTYHSNVEPFLKKMDFFFKKSTNQNLFLSPSSMAGKSREPQRSTHTPQIETTNFSLYKVQNSGVFFNEIMIADKLSRKTRKTNMQISALEKITCSYTGKELVSSPTNLSLPMCALTFLSGQNCTIVWATKSVSSWKLRKNCVIGCKVTLRRKFAHVFLDKLYLYGRQGLLEKKKNFLNHFAFCFGVSKNQDFIELQKSDGFSFGFSGFSVSIK